MLSLALSSLLAPAAYVVSTRPPLVSSSSSGSRARSIQAKSPDFLFELTEDRKNISFGCRQKTVTMVKPEQAGSLQDFMREEGADSIVLSSWDQGQVRRVEGRQGEFLIDVEEFNFVALRFAVELKVRCVTDPASNSAKLESLGFRLVGPGLDGIADLIDVRVSGALTPSAPDARICALSGDVSFVASGELPPILRAAPTASLQLASRAMSESLIAAAAERFSKRVPSAYERWARERATTTSVAGRA